MRTLNLVVVAAVAMSIPLASAARAEDTTVIKKDQPSDSTTVVKKNEGVDLLPVPHPEEHKTIIKKEHHDD